MPHESKRADWAIEVAVTVSIDPVPLPSDYNFCGPTDAVIATAGDSLRWCCTVSNIGAATLQRHTSANADGISILLDLPCHLTDGASAFLTRVQTMASDPIAETGIRTALNPGPVQAFAPSVTAFAFGEPIIFSSFQQCREVSQ